MTELLAFIIGLAIGLIGGMWYTAKYVMVPAMRKALANSGYTIEGGEIRPLDA
jgi:uncharacterized protein YneF (UPF0154 family)